MSEDFVRQFNSGKEKAFETIYNKYISMLRYFGSKYIQDELVLDDILQDIFISLWENRKNFNTEVAIKSYLYTGVKNKCINSLRHDKIKEQYKASIPEEPQEDFLEKVIEAELMDSVYKVFEELPPACKEVYKLSLEGKKHEEIAAELNITINTVKKYKNNANHYMRNRMKDLNILLFYISQDSCF